MSKDQQTTKTKGKWEYFSDPSYFDMYAVRHKDKTGFCDVIHVKTEAEAEFICAMFNQHDLYRETLKNGLSSLKTAALLFTEEELSTHTEVACDYPEQVLNIIERIQQSLEEAPNFK